MKKSLLFFGLTIVITFGTFFTYSSIKKSSLISLATQNIEALTDTDILYLKDPLNSGTCGAYWPNIETVICAVSQVALENTYIKLHFGQPGSWCCSSCSSTSYCNWDILKQYYGIDF